MENTKMKAIKIEHSCKVEDLVPRLVDKPTIKPGYVLINVKAFGVNESEVSKGESDGDFSYPRILGIEGTGVVAEVNDDSSFKVGQKVATMMGGLGRAIDGTYAEYTLVKEENVIPIETQLDWETVGALPEMLQTAYGSLNEGLQLKKDDVLLIRGGTSTVGLMAGVIAKDLGVTVIATSRNPKKIDTLKKYGVDYPLLDDQEFEKNVKKITPAGVDKVLELVGLDTLFQDMSFLKKGGYACFTGALGGKWTIDNFSPFMIPTGVYLTSYAGEASDLPADVFDSVLKKIEIHEISVPIAKAYHGLEEASLAQSDLESGKASGKRVVVL